MCNKYVGSGKQHQQAAEVLLINKTIRAVYKNTLVKIHSTDISIPTKTQMTVAQTATSTIPS